VSAPLVRNSDLRQGPRDDAELEALELGRLLARRCLSLSEEDWRFIVDDVRQLSPRERLFVWAGSVGPAAGEASSPRARRRRLKRLTAAARRLAPVVMEVFGVPCEPDERKSDQ